MRWEWVVFAAIAQVSTLSKFTVAGKMVLIDKMYL
jgi:hypothetical protein